MDISVILSFAKLGAKVAKGLKDLGNDKITIDENDLDLSELKVEDFESMLENSGVSMDDIDKILKDLE